MLKKYWKKLLISFITSALIAFHILIIIFLINFKYSKDGSISEKFYKIDSSFNTDIFMKETAVFLELNKKYSDKKIKWIYKLCAILTPYKNNFNSINIIKSKKTYEAILISKKGEMFYFKDAKMIPAEEIRQEKNFSPYIYPYTPGAIVKKPQKSKFPKPVNFTFFNSLYGYYNNERENSLLLFRILDRRIRFQIRFQAAAQLKNVFTELQQLSKNDKDLKKWLDSIQSTYTFKQRNVKNIDRPSLHSYGIAIDILPKVRDKEFYWQWTSENKKDWWNVKDKDKAYVPQKTIDTFEKYGFIWGGKWFFYDLMHFEYRPELLEYYRLNAADPLKVTYKPDYLKKSILIIKKIKS